MNWHAQGLTRRAQFPIATFLGAVLLLASFAIPSQLLGQSSTFAAQGRVEGAGPPLSVGVASTGIVSDVLVQEGSRVTAGQLLLKLDCRPQQAEVQARRAQLAAAQATYDRLHNGPRPDEIAVGEAAVGYAQASADEAQKTLQRTSALQEGVTVTTARILQVNRDARIAAAQLAEARARLSLLRAGAREEDIRDAKALRDAAAAELDGARARLEQCSVYAPVDGIVLDVLVNRGQFVSLAVPQPLIHIAAGGASRVRAEVALSDLPHVCPRQHATIAAEEPPNAAIPAHVASISLEVTRPRMQMAGATQAAARAQAVVPVVLKIDGDPPALPLGLPVKVTFAACPPKS
jgi:HlyD family secretion protein